jgi:hypothetical protein
LIDGFPEAGQEVQPMGVCVSTMAGAAPIAEEVSTAKPFFYIPLRGASRLKIGITK